MLTITKYVHSCFVVESDARVGIMDPGVFSWDAGIFDIDALARLDDIIITHEHPDHCHLPFLQALIQKFPNAQITTSPAAAAKLRAWGLARVSTEPTSEIELFAAPHEPTEPLNPTPENIGVHYLGLLTNPGDSYQFTTTKSILAMPITAPWGDLVHSAALAADLKPKYVLPIHDWHWNTGARQQSYGRLTTFFEERGITFVPLVDGKSVQL